MNKITQESYLQRVLRVLDYIEDHLDEELDVSVLAQVACFSEFHFHRIFKGMLGETVAQSVRRLRLHRAAGDLIRSSSDIQIISKRAGYGSVEAFGRAFKSAYAQSPAAYREHVKDTPVFNLHQRRDIGMFDVKIENLDDTKIAAVSHQGDYMEVGKSFNKICAWAAQKGLFTPQTKSYGVYFDDPSAVEVDKLRSYAGVTVSEDVSDEKNGVFMHTMKGGKYAVLRFKGPYAELHNAYDWFFGEWLNKADVTPAEAPCYECYVNDPKTTPPSELLTEIMMPLR